MMQRSWQIKKERMQWRLLWKPMLKKGIDWSIETENRHTPGTFCCFGCRKIHVVFLNFFLENIVKVISRVVLDVMFQAPKKTRFFFSKRPPTPFPRLFHDQRQRNYNVWSAVVDWVVVFAETLGNKFSDGMLHHLREKRSKFYRESPSCQIYCNIHVTCKFRNVGSKQLTRHWTWGSSRHDVSGRPNTSSQNLVHQKIKKKNKTTQNKRQNTQRKNSNKKENIAWFWPVHFFKYMYVFF